MNFEIDYKIYRNVAALDSTGLFEIGPGRYSGKHWQNGFVFVREDAFATAEGIVIQNFAGYDHFSMNDIQRNTGLKITSAWRDAAMKLNFVRDSSETAELLNIKESYRNHLEPIAFSDRESIAVLLSQLADECESFYKSDEWICILGM